MGVTVPHVKTTLPVRRALLDRFPYAVVFLEHEDRVHVITVAHYKRRPGYPAGALPARRCLCVPGCLAPDQARGYRSADDEQ